MGAFPIIGWLCLVLAALGIAYTIAAAIAVRRFFASADSPAPSAEAVTILKPLHGAEPRLAANLAGFLTQDHRGPIQLLCGVQRADDPAIEAVETLRAAHPQARIDLVVDATPHGANGKVANLINMSDAIAHPLVILSDSDIAVGRDYLARLVAALARPGVGVVTCLYAGRGDAGFWSRLGAMGASYQFLPNAVFALATGRIGDACMGSTIAMRRETLDAIGGFARFADILADDHAIGAAVRAIGLKIAVPPMLVTHASDEASPSALWRHEVRWAATVRDIIPARDYLGTMITLPFPLALLGVAFHPAAGLTAAAAALLARALVVGAVNRATGRRGPGPALLPLRDILSFAVFVASFCVRSVDWRGHRLRISAYGRIAADTELPR